MQEFVKQRFFLPTDRHTCEDLNLQSRAIANAHQALGGMTLVLDFIDEQDLIFVTEDVD